MGADASIRYFILIIAPQFGVFRNIQTFGAKKAWSASYRRSIFGLDACEV